MKILREIWTEMKALNGRTDQTNLCLDKTREELSARLEAVRVELEEETSELRRRMVDSELPLATATTQLAADIQQLTSVIRDWREEHRADRAELEGRVRSLEEWRRETEARLRQ